MPRPISATKNPLTVRTNPRSGRIGIHSLALEGMLEGSVYIGEPLPGNQYRLFLMTSGFGINAKLVGTFHPDPRTGQLTAHFEDLPQVPFDEFQIHLFASDRGLMATPTSCSVYPARSRPSCRGIRPCQPSTPGSTSGWKPVPRAAPAPGRCGPSTRPLKPGPPTRAPAPLSSFTLKLNREDGDQFLGNLNFTMPPGLTANLHGVTYCPEADIAAAANTAGKVEQAQPSCPSALKSAPPMSPPGPDHTPFTPSARSIWPDRFRERPESGRRHPGAGRSL